MSKVYSDDVITKAKDLFSQGASIREICRATGIKSTSTVMYYCDSRYRENMKRAGAEWRKKNVKRWRKICRKAAQNSRNK